MALAMIHSLVPSMTTMPPMMNGKAFAETLPGVSSPFGFFDPLNMTPESKVRARARLAVVLRAVFSSRRCLSLPC